MKPFKVFGLCLVAVFALGALGASGASASPEYQVCVKAAKIGNSFTGKYDDKLCSSADPKGEGQYERAEWNKGKKASFKGKNVGTPKNIIVNPVETPAKTEGVTECTQEKLAGEVTGPKTTKWKTFYKKCKGNGVPCNTKGQGNETIVTDELEATLVNLSKEGAETQRVGMRVKGLGPGGRLAEYECPLTKIDVSVYGEVLAEVKGNLNTANKSTQIALHPGPLNLQSDLYEEESNTEAEGKGYFVWGFGFEACLKEELEKGHSFAEAEAICFGKLGPWPGYPAKPISLISVVEGAINAKAPSVQNGVTEEKGEAFLIGTGGKAPPTASVVGTVTETPAKPADGAIVSICGTGGCYGAETEADGSYEISGVVDGNYIPHISPPTGSPDGELTSSSFSVSGTGATTANFTLLGPTPVPAGTTVESGGTLEIGGNKYPRISSQAPSPITTQACKGGSVTATVIFINTQTGMPESTGPAAFGEAPLNSGTFTGNLPAVFPLHGEGTVEIKATGCVFSSVEVHTFTAYFLAELGKVVDENNGNAPLPGATVILKHSLNELGSYEALETTSSLMTLVSRVNAVTSGTGGKFGWEVYSPGFYEVVAEKENCGKATSAIVEGPATIAPELKLACKPPLEITTSSLPEGTAGKPYGPVELEAIGGVPPYKWKKGASPKLPKGLKVKAGKLEGTPKVAPGTYPIKVKVSDNGKKAKATVEAELSLKLN